MELSLPLLLAGPRTVQTQQQLDTQVETPGTRKVIHPRPDIHPTNASVQHIGVNLPACIFEVKTVMGYF